MNRAYYIDRIRVVLTAMVVMHHTAITYGAPGGWYYRELPTEASLTGLILILFVSVNQAYFMGFFFLIAGYFTPASYERKGPARFALDRVIRLGIPLAFFAVVLDPLTNAIAEAWGETLGKAQPFWYGFLHRVAKGDWNPGPLWFAEALLIFSAGYMVWRAWHGKEIRRPDAPLPSVAGWFLSAVAVGAGALLIRQWVPVGKNVFGLQLGYFSSYVFLFGLGVVAWRRNWFDRLTWPKVRLWTIVSIANLPGMVITVMRAGRSGGAPVTVAGGLGFAAIVYAFWEPFVAWGIIAAYLVCFRKYGNKPSPVWEYLASCAYAVYILHAPVLVGVSVALRGWQAPALAKAAVTGPLAILATLGVSSIVLRVPGVRRVV